MLDPATFRRPWTMAPFAVPRLGELWLRATPAALFAALFRLQGLGDRGAMSTAEIYAYQALLERVDGGRAFLRIMRSFELTEEKRDFLWSGLADRRYPARIVWGKRDPALGAQQLAIAGSVLGVDEPVLVDAKHFLPEDQAPAIANVVADVAAPLG
jgi:pimeloyl-ACP methyl ester carboxylesterase